MSLSPPVVALVAPGRADKDGLIVEAGHVPPCSPGRQLRFKQRQGKTEMQDFIENAKRAANTAIERAAFEADKLRRSANRQHEVDLAQRERTTLLEQIASLVLDLDARGQLGSDALRQVATRLRQLDDEIANGRGEAEAIRSEQYTPGSVQISITRTDAGGSGGSSTSRAPSSAGAAPIAASAPCPTCGKPVRVGAAFCANCGARMR
ncbi:MAG TPA: zinc ribbon domain-containing protein [Ktedonobacterales bacterium]|nr:zinc ribbon domain-containing protein [Ktedonobacterales bacterium]